MDLALLITTIFLGTCVLTSYVFIFGYKMYDNYMTHLFWMDIPTTVVKTLIPLQFLACIGFIIAISSWIINPPKGGVMGRNLIVLPLTVGAFLITSAVWPIAVYYKIHWLTVSTLIGTAISSIVMLAGSIEEENPRWWIVLGLIALSTVTVLTDGVIWNAKYISKLSYDPAFFKQWD